MKAQILIAAYAVDLAIGDPHAFPHPVRLIGKSITVGERIARRIIESTNHRSDEKSDTETDAHHDNARSEIIRSEVIGGAILTASVIAASYTGACLLLDAATKIDKNIGVAAEVMLAWTTLATNSLLTEAGAVLDSLAANDLTGARTNLSRIVGRDTKDLDESEIARAVIETIAESTCDGIIAPLAYLAVGGVPLAFAYKAANTLDSMIGHIETPYRFFGRVAARTDDAANLIPARLTALAIICAAKLLNADPRAAWRIFRRDASLHKSPNAGQSEAAMSGALRVRLGGTNFYDGVAHDGAIFGGEYERATLNHARASLRVALVASLIGCGVACVFACLKR